MGYRKKLNKYKIFEWKTWYIRYEYLCSLFHDEKVFMESFKNELSKIEEFFMYAEREIINAKRLVINEQKDEIKKFFSEPERAKNGTDLSTSSLNLPFIPESDVNNSVILYSRTSSSSSSESSTSSDDRIFDEDKYISNHSKLFPFRNHLDSSEAIKTWQDHTILTSSENMIPKKTPDFIRSMRSDLCNEEKKAYVQDNIFYHNRDLDINYRKVNNDTIIEIDEASHEDMALDSENIKKTSNKASKIGKKTPWAGILTLNKKKIFKNNIFMKTYDKNMNEKALLDYISDLKQIIKYRNLNLLGFKKILYKYDKAKGRNITHILMPLIERSYFNRSRDIDSIAKEASLNYQLKYYKNNPKQAKNILKRINRKEKPNQLAMFLFGASLALSMVFHVYLVSLKEFYEYANYYYSVISFPLSFILFGLCLIVFKAYHINYNYIFNFNYRSKIDNNEFLLFSCIMVLLHQCSAFTLYKTCKAYILLILLAVFCFPFNIMHRSSRYALIGTTLKVFSAPFCSVKFKHFFMADLLQSHSLSIKVFLMSNSLDVGNPLYLFVAFPAIIRILQCLRRYFDEKLAVHIYNGLKYLLSVINLVMGLYELNFSCAKYIRTTFMFLTSIYSLYWDLFIDWNIFRSKYLFPTSVYIVISLFNFLVRFTWVFKSYIRRDDSFYILIEIVRRFGWLMIRVEHEHLNNCNQLKAMKYVKLPFQETFYRKNYEPLDTESKDLSIKSCSGEV